MRTILKYQLDTEIIGNPQVIKIHASADILSAQLQGDKIQLWADVPNAASGVFDNRHFVFIGTGQLIEYKIGLLHIATIQKEDKVWHLFEVIE